MNENLQPTHYSERIGALDFLRGLAILGILIINIENFCYPDSWSPVKYGFADTADHSARFWVYFLTQGKSYSMLALLFGVGFYIFIERLEQKNLGVKAFDLYGRRLLWLFLFGVVHAYLIWDGDILHHYAACGLLFFPFRSFSTKTLLIILIIPISIQLLHSYLSAEYTSNRYTLYLEAQHKIPDTRNAAELKSIEDWENETKKESADTTFFKAPRKTYGESIETNASHMKISYGRIYNQGILYRTLIMMILGIVLFRKGIFKNYRLMKSYWPLTITLLLIALFVNYQRYYHWTYESFIPVTSFWKAWLFTFPKELLGLAYVLLFNGLYQLLFKNSRFNFISGIGRSALSNYIFQSIICGFIFYGYGLGMYNQFSRLELLYVVSVIWLVQICLTWLWLKKFKYGPLEWLWRRLTYGSFDKV